MDVQEIRSLTQEWNKAVWQVIELQHPEVDEVRRLFGLTFRVLDDYRAETLVPKELSALLLEMQDFGWWVSDLEETPLHRWYQEILSVVIDLKTYFLTGAGDPQEMAATLEKLGE